jgi:molybdate transport system substrate-binding protein
MFASLLTMAVALVAMAPQNVPERPIVTVSAAVSLTDALMAVAQEYARAGGGTIRFNFGASNVLARQIVNGAPVDLFISADAAQMDVVARAGLLKDQSRVDLLTNQLAVVVPNDRRRTFASIKDLTGQAYRRIAIGDPEAVPAGVYAKQYLEGEGLWTAIEPRVVPSASVRAALVAVESGAADAAIVYRTDARVSTRASVAFVVPAERGPKIVYPAAIVRTSTEPAESQRFMNFLRSAAGARVFERFGFGTAR